MTNESTNSREFEGYISQVEAARILGVSKQAVTGLVRRGYFNTIEVAGRILILRSEAESLTARPKRRSGQEASGKQKTSKVTKRAHKESSEKYVSRAEAARMRGVSQPAIADLIRRGRLSSISIAGRILVIRSEVETFVPQPRTGRPPKKKTTEKMVRPKKSRK